jgi:hypothetical protein
MDIISRVKNILVTPKTEWVTIEAERLPSTQVLTSYLLLLALIPAVGQLIGQGFIGTTVLGIKVGGTLSIGIRSALVSYISAIGGAYLVAWIINLLATSFGSEKNFNQAFALVVYANTATYVVGVFYILPALSMLAMIAGLYSLYLLYIGLQPMMKTPADKTVVYFIISLVCLIAASLVLAAILTPIFIALFFFL